MRNQRAASNPTRMPETSLKAHALVFLLLGILVAAGYAVIVNLPFLSDDYAIIRLVTYPDGVTNWSELLRDFYTPLFFHDASPFFRPMYVLSYGINFALHGTWAAPYHLTNVVLHLVVSFFVYLVALELAPEERRRGIAVTAGAIFALYPLHLEAVTWIAGRVDLICAVFYFPALLFSLRWLRTGRRLHLILSLAFFALSLLSKEMAVTLPGLFFVCALYRRKTLASSIMATVPFALVVGAYLLVRAIVLSGVDPYGGSGRDLHVFASFGGLLYRTMHAFFPLNFGLLPTEWQTFAGIALILLVVPLGVVLALAWQRGWNGGFPVLPLVLYVLTLAPVFKFLKPDPLLTSSRWFYIPSALLAIFIAGLLWSAFGERGRRASFAAVVVCVAFLAILLVNQGPWLRAGEIAEQHLRTEKNPGMGLKYEGAHVFGAKITWIAANSPPFKEP